MNVAEPGKLEGILDELRHWPTSERVRLARMIVETVETNSAGAPPRQRSLRDLLGILKTDAPTPTDEECRAILEEELIKKRVK